MFLGIATLVVAIVISVVAAYYSILGLTAIFAAAFWPIVIMGGALETGKVMAAVWLHRNWKRASWAYKFYLVPALAFLMLLTSMGIFGFLSKAHLDQTVPTGDVAAQVALIDEKIKIERDTIDNARAVIKQLDDAVNGISAKGSDREIKLRDGSTYTRSAAEQALQVRRSQARDRAALTKQVEQAQANIVKLQEQKAPIAKDLRKIEAEVGPVKYVAALIYGDNPDTNTLEKAVRWVIILIVLVFDPLAIVLILAGSKQIEWARGINFEQEDHHREVMRQRAIEDEEKLQENLQQQQQEQKDIVDIETANVLASELEPEIDVDQLIEQAKKLQEIEQQQQTYIDTITAQELEIQDLNKNIDDLSTAITTLTDEIQDLEKQVANDANENSRLHKENISLVSDLDKKNLELLRLQKQQKDLQDKLEELSQASEETELSIPATPKKESVDLMFSPVADNNEMFNGSNAGFGNSFPADPEKGDLFLRVDYLPTKLFKWNGVKWIEVDKGLTDSYTYNEKYIEHLIDRINKGDYDTDDLSDREREQIEEYLRKNNAQ